MTDEMTRALERWPGYEEQSWQQRFAELDRRYQTLSLRAFDTALGFAAERAAAVAQERERCLKEAVLQIAKAAHAIGWQAGVGGMETAGAIVSYLAQHQDQIPLFFAGEVSPVDWRDFTHGGCLTWHAQNGGGIVHPADVRAAAIREGAGA